MDADDDALEAFVTNTLTIPHGGQHTANAADSVSTVESSAGSSTAALQAEITADDSVSQVHRVKSLGTPPRTKVKVHEP